MYKMSCETWCFRTIHQIWKTVLEHPIPQLILYEKSVAKRNVSKLFSEYGEQFRNISFHNLFYTKNQLQNRIFRNYYLNLELSTLFLVISSHLHKDKTIIS